MTAMQENAAVALVVLVTIVWLFLLAVRVGDLLDDLATLDSQDEENE